MSRFLKEELSLHGATTRQQLRLPNRLSFHRAVEAGQLGVDGFSAAAPESELVPSLVDEKFQNENSKRDLTLLVRRSQLQRPLSTLRVRSPLTAMISHGPERAVKLLKETSLCARSCSCGPESSACVTVRGEASLAISKGKWRVVSWHDSKVYVWGAISCSADLGQVKRGKRSQTECRLLHAGSTEEIRQSRKLYSFGLSRQPCTGKRRLQQLMSARMADSLTSAAAFHSQAPDGLGHQQQKTTSRILAQTSAPRRRPSKRTGFVLFCSNHNGCAADLARDTDSCAYACCRWQ